MLISGSKYALAIYKKLPVIPTNVDAHVIHSFLTLDRSFYHFKSHSLTPKSLIVVHILSTHIENANSRALQGQLLPLEISTIV